MKWFARWPIDAILLTLGLAGLALLRGDEFGDFAAVAMGLCVGCCIVVVISKYNSITANLRALMPRRGMGAAAGLGAVLLLGLLGQGTTAVAFRMASTELERGRYATAHKYYILGRRASTAFSPVTFYLDTPLARLQRNSSALYSEARELMESGRWCDAEQVYRSCILIEPDRVQLRGDLGTSLYRQTRYWDAAREFLAVLDKDPRDLIALYHLAMTRVRLGQFDEAEDLVKRILSIETDGSVVGLIRNNPEFEPLRGRATYRRLLGVRKGSTQAPGERKVK